jgi:hypothetical protein
VLDRPAARTDRDRRDEGEGMPHHDEKPASALAHGSAKPDDIERVRRDVGTAEARHATSPSVERAVGEMEAACQTIRDDIDELKRVLSDPADA